MMNDIAQLSPEAVVKLMDHVFEFMEAHKNKLHILKPSGKIIENADARRDYAKEIVRMSLHLGLPVAVIHGAGKQIDKALRDAGLESEKDAQGLRVSRAAHIPYIDRAALDANELLCEEIYKASEGKLNPHGMAGHHPDLNMVGMPIDAAGDNFSVAHIRSMNPHILLREIFTKATVPVITNMVQLDIPAGGVTIGNGNADTVANFLAMKLQAFRLLLSSDVPGVLEQVKDKDNKVDIGKLKTDEVRRLIGQGILRVIPEITPEMLPVLRQKGIVPAGSGMDVKLNESFDTASKMGPDAAVVILDHNISAETLMPLGYGTAFKARGTAPA